MDATGAGKECPADAGEEGRTDTGDPCSFAVNAKEGLLLSGHRGPSRKQLARIENSLVPEWRRDGDADAREG